MPNGATAQGSATAWVSLLPGCRAGLALMLVLAGCLPTLVRAQEAAPPAQAAAGQFFPPISEPIRDDDLERLRNATDAYLFRASAEGQRPVLVFELRPGEQAPGAGGFGVASDLVYYLAGLRGARKTVAFVPEPLTGYSVLAALACDEVVLGPNATLGPILPEGQAPGERERAVARDLTRLKGRETDLLMGLLDPTLDLREVRTADGAAHFVLRENLEAFGKANTVVEDRPAWEGQRGVLTPERARRSFVKYLTADRGELASVYGLPSTAIDPTLAAPPRAFLLPIEGRITPLAESYLLRQIARIPGEDVNLVFVVVNSEGGLSDAASKVADALAALPNVKTVAFLDDRALGVASLIPLACDEIVFKAGARMGDVTRQLPDRDGESEALDERLGAILADRAEALARKKGHPAAVARAMVDPAAVVHKARDSRTGAVVFVLDRDVRAEPQRYEVLETPKSAEGQVLILNDAMARAYQMADRVVRDAGELEAAYGVSPDRLKRAKRTWVDGLVDTLNAPWMKGLLLFVGFFMLVLELKLPGIGLPAITSALAFLLYFWSSYLGGTADQLEFLLFLGGLLCLALELFVFPGFGVFGMSGVALILMSVVMASHTFVWPTQPYEYRELAWSLGRVLGVIAGVIAGVVVVGRLFPTLPFYHRVILQPEPYESDFAAGAKPPVDLETELSFLYGEVGRTTSVLRPSGKARFAQFGDMLVDVTADGFFIEADQPVEVVEVRGARVVVKRVDGGARLES